MRQDRPQSIADAGSWVRWADCPDCKGRGWFLINPFATGGGGGAGGAGNARQCQKCKTTHEYFQSHGKLPS
jgi:hypothetical protein